LPGGDFPAEGYETEVTKLKTRYAFLADPLARRMIRRYGTRATALLGTAGSITDLGRNFGSDLYEVEVRYLIAQEWAHTAADVLWRRSKKGLYLSKEEAAALDIFMTEATAD
jgi:glycerol-3-phosphate dehydrogenase